MKRQRPNSPPKPDAATHADDWAEVGVIAGAFGLHGEVKVQPETAFPERFASTPTIYLGDERTPYAIEQARAHKQQIVLQLRDVTSIEAAEALRGQRVWIPASLLMPLPEGQFYLHDVIGLEVRHVDGRVLGTVRDILSGTGNDLFVIARAPVAGAEGVILAQQDDVLLPAVKAFIMRVDLEARVMIVDPIPGLFDEGYEEAR